MQRIGSIGWPAGIARTSGLLDRFVDHPRHFGCIPAAHRAIDQSVVDAGHTLS